jgi:hypothetical protein
MSIAVIIDSERLIPAAIYPLIKIEKTGDLLYLRKATKMIMLLHVNE